MSLGRGDLAARAGRHPPPMDSETIRSRSPNQRHRRWRFTPFRIVFALLFVFLGTFGFLLPGLILAQSFFDPALNAPGIPRMALRLHQSITPRYERWATARITAGQVATKTENVSGTEWPLYGSVFYLLGEEQLQAAWEADHRLLPEEPRRFAHEAIEAAARLVSDPKHATWVRNYWGEEYLQKEDVFYRMLLISALASHRHLTGSDQYLALLRTQTDGLAQELSASRSGVLDDYPGQCYPTDVLSAWGAIQRADAALGTDHSAQIAAASRGFTGDHAAHNGLPPFAAFSPTGQPLDESRGCGNSNACMQALSLWPELGQKWYSIYERDFWQHDWLAAGFREYLRGTPNAEWGMEVDAGPVIRGNGFAACAFGIAAARSNGRFDHAYLLSLEAIALSWPWPNGRLIIPRFVSNPVDAPLIGESAIFYQLTTPVSTTVHSLRHHQGRIPAIVFICLALYFGVALLFYRRALWTVRPVEK
jgi:hypothetical protein